ncbi:MAG: S8 family serine peptidase [Alphaproteobacteria bacterium]|nr:S8 family serine peptidase [Alphaproteobacteria bacterium]MDE2492960.1 S8 family serine peptidase [Alphaproteobacteria bacterium]
MKKPGRPWKIIARATAAGVLMACLTNASWGQLGGLPANLPGKIPGGLPGGVAGGVPGAIPAGVPAGLPSGTPAGTLGGALSSPLGGSVPVGPVLQNVPQTVTKTVNGVDQTLQSTINTTQTTIDTVKRDIVGRPLLTAALARDPQGARIVRGEILAVSPSTTSLAAVKRLNFGIERTETLSSLGLTAVVLSVPNGMNTSDALAALKKADPQGTYDYNHIYDPSGAMTPHIGGGVAMPVVHVSAIRIGMIDGGVVQQHPAFSDATIIAKDIAGEHHAPPTAHGTAVASLLVGDDGDFHGYLPGATLYVADAFGGEATGGSVIDLVRALNWLAGQRVAVVNASLAGPPNALLQAGVRAFLAGGHVLVAAVGNNGPAAPLAYPASYPGVIAVTSVDRNRRLQVDANRGDVTFAAIGVDVRTAALRGYTNDTGTSFATPVVAARFALLIPAPNSQTAERARLALERVALPMGKGPGDPAFGYGYLPPPSLALARR